MCNFGCSAGLGSGLGSFFFLKFRFSLQAKALVRVRLPKLGVKLVGPVSSMVSVRVRAKLGVGRKSR